MTGAETEPLDDLSFGSLFSGVGGFDLGFEAAGWRCGWQVEWDTKCQSVLGRHWPDVPRWGDVQTVSGYEVPPVDCVLFGSPCQDLSIAGRRAGLDGSRSGLFFEATRIIKEMRDATDAAFPRWAVWENVPGALSSNGGADFGAVLDALADVGAVLLEWHVLDARWFGVPQRRRRVFVVACFDSGTAGRCPDPLLPVAPRSGWHPPTFRTAREVAASVVAGSVGADSVATDAGRGFGFDGDVDADDAYAVPFRQGSFGQYVPNEVGTLKASGGDTGGGSETFLVQPAVLVRHREGKPGGGKGPLLSEDQSLTLATANDQTLFQPFPTTSGTGPIGFSHTQGLDCQPSHDAFPTLRAEGSGHAVLAGGEVGQFNSIDGSVSSVGGDVSVQVDTVVSVPMVPRRLMPVECERLQGWPDDHTRWFKDGSEVSDSVRYHMVGNGVAAPVARWIAECIGAADVEARRG